MKQSSQKSSNGGEEASRKCPNCHSKRNWKDGIRRTKEGFSQRFVCRDCGYRFSESSVLSTNQSHSKGRQVCAVLTEAKNLTKVEPLKNGLAGATVDVKGKIIEFMWKLRREGLEAGTIRTYAKSLMMLKRRGANLLVPESINDVLALQDKWKDTTKAILAASYQRFAAFNGLAYEKPRLKPK